MTKLVDQDGETVDADPEFSRLQTVASQQPVETPVVSAINPYVILAGIKQFGLASDGADLQDLRAAIDRLLAERDAALARAEELRHHLAVAVKVARDCGQKGYADIWASILSEASSPVPDPVSQIVAYFDRIYGDDNETSARRVSAGWAAGCVRRGDYLAPAAGTET
jgi:hypothetical protein